MDRACVVHGPDLVVLVARNVVMRGIVRGRAPAGRWLECPPSARFALRNGGLPVHERKTFLHRHPIVTCFGIAFLLSYGGFVLLDGPKLLRHERIQPSD